MDALLSYTKRLVKRRIKRAEKYLERHPESSTVRENLTELCAELVDLEKQTKRGHSSVPRQEPPP